MDALNKWTESGKNLFNLLRDAALFGLIILLVGCPTVINDRLTQTGIASIDAAGIKWQRQVEEAKADSLAAVSQVEQVKQANREALAKVESIVAANPEIEPQVSPIISSIRQTSRRLDEAGEQLDMAVVRQQDILEKAAPEAAAISGWIWLTPQAVTVDGEAEPGAIAVVTTRLRVRSGAGPARSAVAVLPRGTRVRIEEMVTQSGVQWARVTVVQ